MAALLSGCVAGLVPVRSSCGLLVLLLIAGACHQAGSDRNDCSRCRGDAAAIVDVGTGRLNESTFVPLPPDGAIELIPNADGDETLLIQVKAEGVCWDESIVTAELWGCRSHLIPYPQVCFTVVDANELNEAFPSGIPLAPCPLVDVLDDEGMLRVIVTVEERTESCGEDARSIMKEVAVAPTCREDDTAGCQADCFGGS